MRVSGIDARARPAATLPGAGARSRWGWRTFGGEMRGWRPATRPSWTGRSRRLAARARTTRRTCTSAPSGPAAVPTAGAPVPMLVDGHLLTLDNRVHADPRIDRLASSFVDRTDEHESRRRQHEVRRFATASRPRAPAVAGRVDRPAARLACRGWANRPVVAGWAVPNSALLFRPEQVVVVDPTGNDRRRELPGRHLAQRHVAVPVLSAGQSLDERPRAGGLEHAGVERPALPDPVQLAGERLPLAPGHDPRQHQPARAVRALEAAQQRLALDPPVRHAQPQHRTLFGRHRSGAARCRLRLPRVRLRQA